MNLTPIINNLVKALINLGKIRRTWPWPNARVDDRNSFSVLLFAKRK